MDVDWGLLAKKKTELEHRIASSDIGSSDRIELQKKLAKLGKFLLLKEEIRRHELAAEKIRQELLYLTDSEMKSLFEQELLKVIAELEEQREILENALIPADEHDNRSVFLEIRAGTGGQEAALFAADLIKMYTNYALKKGWRVSLVDESLTDLGGVREAVMHIEGENVYAHLKFEAGVHRVQRVPKTETAGRVHTSTATVAVLPEAEEVDVNINPADLRIDVYRASGAGGQHVNTTDSAVRITHIPSGVVVACQDERSQHKNKAKALKMLQSRILAFEKERQHAEVGAQRKEMVGSAQRSEKIRTYNFPQNRVTDHQVDITLKKLDYIMAGDLDDLIIPLQKADLERRKKGAVLDV
ncbi:peptide chain release factor 1 [bacterium]|nr:MAG: peptide chain release factor 1 [bacterium]QQR61983.1 MAG: peptide chain release factor 1 [bacterium]QQR62424.1 MAG: peptide chain release factor 1 [bacterium]